MKRRKSIRQHILELTYHKPYLDTKMVSLKKSFGEISSILNGKTKK